VGGEAIEGKGAPGEDFLFIETQKGKMGGGFGFFRGEVSKMGEGGKLNQKTENHTQNSGSRRGLTLLEPDENCNCTKISEPLQSSVPLELNKQRPRINTKERVPVGRIPSSFHGDSVKGEGGRGGFKVFSSG